MMIPTIAEAAQRITAKNCRRSVDEITPRSRPALDDELRAFVHLTEERALAEARAAEAAIAAPNDPKSPLHGVDRAQGHRRPLLQGPTTCRSLILQDNIPNDATCAEKLAAAGSVPVDKPATTNSPMATPASTCRRPPAHDRGTPTTSPPAAAAAPARRSRRDDPLRHRHRRASIRPAALCGSPSRPTDLSAAPGSRRPRFRSTISARWHGPPRIAHPIHAPSLPPELTSTARQRRPSDPGYIPRSVAGSRVRIRVIHHSTPSDRKVGAATQRGIERGDRDVPQARHESRGTVCAAAG